MGDIVARSPLAAALRRAWPDCWITWMVERGNREAIDANPHLDEIILWDSNHFSDMLSRRWKNLMKQRRALGLRWVVNALRLTIQMRRCQFDVFISYQPEAWAWLIPVAGAPVSIGVFPNVGDRDVSRSPGNKDFKRWARRYRHSRCFPDLPMHHTDHALVPLDFLGLPTATDKTTFLGFVQEDDAAVDVFLRGHGVRPGDRLLAIAPTTTWVTKSWPLERYAAVGDALAREHRCRILLTGTQSEREDVERVASQMAAPAIVAAGEFSFRQLAALISRVALVISGDTGPMHMAAALKTPYVALFGPTMPERFVPVMGLGRSLAHDVPCGPCGEMRCANTGEDYIRCMRLIEVPEVLAAVRALIPGP